MHRFTDLQGDTGCHHCFINTAADADTIPTTTTFCCLTNQFSAHYSKLRRVPKHKLLGIV